MDRHRAAVAAIAADVARLVAAKQPFRIAHGSTNSTRPARRGRTVDTSALCHVLRVDRAARTALVEPNVPMDRLVDVTLKHGLLPPVVMEFPGITAGGGYNGTSGESSSFRHGYFNHSLNSVEMVMADGKVNTASPTQNADLFYGGAGACGTLGVTTLLELQLVEAKKYVKTTYHPVTSVDEAVSKIQAMTHDKSIDYLDGILFSKCSGAIITGTLTDELQGQPQTFTGAWDPWFYVHVQGVVSGGAPVTEYVPVWDYLFRYDRGGFWVGRSAFSYFSLSLPRPGRQMGSKLPARPIEIPLVPFTRLTRWLLDDFMRTRMLYAALHASGQSSRYMVQDLALPYDRAGEFIDWCAAETGIWPLWLCPLAAARTAPTDGGLEGTFHPQHPDRPHGMLNVGLWGLPPPYVFSALSPARLWAAVAEWLWPRPADADADAARASFADGAWRALNRRLEAALARLGGKKWLYAHTFYTPGEFWAVYDGAWYGALRAKYGAGGLPSVHDKVGQRTAPSTSASGAGWKALVKSVWPVAGLYGVLQAARSGEWRKARRRQWASIEPEEESKGEGEDEVKESNGKIANARHKQA